MTPFIECLSNALWFWCDVILKAYCYFFGHKWGEWEDDYGGYTNSPLGRHKECKRCGEFKFNSQMLKKSLPDREEK